MMGGDGEHCGITPRIVKQVFDTVEKSDESLMFEIGVQYVEIYMEKLKDLLDSKILIK
jgi:kinesin family protein 5